MQDVQEAVRPGISESSSSSLRHSIRTASTPEMELRSHSKQTELPGSLIQKHDILTSIFQMFRFERRSQWEFPFLSTPLNPKPAALLTASAVVFKKIL